MKFSTSYLNKLADRMLNRQSQSQALKKIVERKDWKATIRKCHDKVTEEYKFWLAKQVSDLRERKLLDLHKDISFIKSIEGKSTLSEQELKKLQVVATKYNIT